MSHMKSRLFTARFFLLGLVKNLIYAEKIQFYGTYKRKLTRVAPVTPEMLKQTWQEVDHCLCVCRTVNGVRVDIF